MPLSDDYLKYPARRHEMDHDRYDWSDLFDRRKLSWPNGAKIALWISPAAQWFPLDMTSKPFLAPGGLTMPFPDLRHYTNRDYGNRVGIYRVLQVLKDYGLPASFALNGMIAERYPQLVEDVAAAGHEIIAHGLDMGHLHHSGLSSQEEEALVTRTLQSLRDVSGLPIVGWLSPGRAQSFSTPEILARHGVRYACDWANDDLPYVMRTDEGPIYAMPYAYETDDRVVMLELHQTEESWVAQIKDRFDVLYREAERFGGRVLSLPLHAWVSGAPYRISYVREALDYILKHSGVWASTGVEILDLFEAQYKAEGPKV
jgi:allantoinase